MRKEYIEKIILAVLDDIPERKKGQANEIIKHGMETGEPWEDILNLVSLLTDTFMDSVIRGEEWPGVIGR